RVRDKVAASKRKGMWMGGSVPLGYDVLDRKLVINRDEAATVLLIFRRYLELGSVRELLTALAAGGMRTKIQTLRDGRRRGGIIFSRAALYWLLKNPVYIGQVRHHKAVYEGQHEPLVPIELWEQVQASLAENGTQRQLGTNAAEPSLLAGRINDAEGRPMIASHAKKGPRRYRYYISPPSDQGGDRKTLRLPAGEVEALVRQGLTALLSDGGKLAGDLEAADAGPVDLEMIARHSLTAARIADMSITELRRVLLDLDARIAVEDQRLGASYAPRRLISPDPSVGDETRLPFSVPGVLTRQGHEARLVLVTDQPGRRRPNARLVALLVRSFAARRMLLHDRVPAGTPAAQTRKSHLCRLARMSYLAPDIVQAIFDGTQPPTLGATQMLRTGELPVSWAEQRRLFGFRSSPN
ncbi:MAG: recombinase family protein, partial [Vicinamibacterales bacterium]